MSAPDTSGAAALSASSFQAAKLGARLNAVPRHKLLVPIIFGVLAILFTIAIIVGWNVMFTKYYTLHKRAVDVNRLGTGYWLILSLGDVFLVMVLVVLVIFLVSNVKKEVLVARQNTFIDSVTHELKSPLASIRLALDTFELREPPPEMRGKFVRLMQEDVERLMAFIDRVLEAGRLQHGERIIAREVVDLSAMARGCAARMLKRHRLPEGVITIDDQLKTGIDVGRYHSDLVALETIVDNLLDNAVKYSGPRPEITLHLRQDDLQRPVISVTDRGVGIPEGQTRTIFDRFARLDRAKEREVRGTGLGLYLAATLTNRLTGRLWAESAGEGEGSTFHLQLPSAVRSRQLAGMIAEDDPERAPDTPWYAPVGHALWSGLVAVGFGLWLLWRYTFVAFFGTIGEVTIWLLRPVVRLLWWALSRGGRYTWRVFGAIGAATLTLLGLSGAPRSSPRADDAAAPGRG